MGLDQWASKFRNHKQEHNRKYFWNQYHVCRLLTGNAGRHPGERDLGTYPEDTEYIAFVSPQQTFQQDSALKFQVIINILILISFWVQLFEYVDRP